jgi:putative ABC transport system permease protein
VQSIPGLETEPPKETLVRKRVIETLEPSEVLVGADVAASLGVKEDGLVDIMGESFTVIAVLPQTGTVDDSRIFAHLHTVQRLGEKGPVINAVEVVGCCNEIMEGLVDKINRLLPEAKVVTVMQVVETQVRTNRMMARLSMIFLVIIILVGVASIANYMYANVYERRREIGTLMALGATPSVVLRIFLFKALILGLAGGVGGYVLGTVLSLVLGPRIAGIPVLPMPVLVLWAMGVSVGISLAASFFPARRAAGLDPCTSLQEV